MILQLRHQTSSHAQGFGGGMIRTYTEVAENMNPKDLPVTAMGLTKELAFMKNRIMNSGPVNSCSGRRRKRMEAAKGGGEVRRLHIIYFLSRMGRIEHPHLIRLHHLTRNGVYLRDVKRWLADLRGKDMPEAFAWSYKRRYKMGYVWQDLLDDDLITPISDNEYVLKGSEIVPTIPLDLCSYGGNKVSILKNDHEPVDVEDTHQQQPSPKEALIDLIPKIDTPTKTSSEIYEESCSESSSITDDSMKHEKDPSKQNSCTQQSEKFENFSSSSFYTLNKRNRKSSSRSNSSTSNNNNNNNNSNIDEKRGTVAGSSFLSSSSWSQPPLRKSKSYSRGASQMLRNLISCGAVDTNDAVLVMVNRANKPFPNNPANKPDNETEICKGEKLGGSTRVFGTSWNQQQQHTARKSCDGVRGSKKKQGEYASPKAVSAPYKPLGGPTCS